MTSLRCFLTTAFAVLPPSIAARTASVSVFADASSAFGSIGGFGKYTGLPPTPLATICAVFASALGSSLPKPVTALSDAGFLVVVAAGAVVAGDAGAAVVLGAGEDMEHHPFLKLRAIALALRVEMGTLTVLPPNRHSGDVNRGFALSG